MLTVSHLRKTFVDDDGAFDVLKDVTFSLGKGEMVALIGASGAGKTTLLQLLGGLDKPTGGSIQINGREMNALSPREMSAFRSTSIGFVFQFHHLLSDFTALENTFVPGLITGKTRAACIERAKYLLNQVGLDRQIYHFPSELSGGERQRVALARALFNEPALILADEPTGNLDGNNGGTLLELFKKANRDQNQTFLVATHNDHLAAGMHRTIRLGDGRIL